MSISYVFNDNHIQAIRLPANMRFPGNVKQVVVRARGNERIITPVDHAWDSFFNAVVNTSDDFISERSSQHQAERDSL